MTHSSVGNKSKSESWATVNFNKEGLLPPEYVHKQYKDSQGHSTVIQGRIADDMAGWIGDVIDHHPNLANTSDLLRTALLFYLGYVSKAMSDNPELFETSKLQIHSRELDRIRRLSEEKDKILGTLDRSLDKAFTNMDYSQAEKLIFHGRGMASSFEGPYKAQLEKTLDRYENMLNRALGRKNG